VVQKGMDRKEKVRRLIPALKKLLPDAGMILNFSNHWELLVAVMLSAQCTDKKVNEVTAKLFKKYPTFRHYLKASPKEFEKDIHSTGFYRNKTKNVLAAAKYVQETFGGKIPTTMIEMLAIPGVARKTANVVLGNAHGIVEGIAVDTHVMRLAQVFDLTDYSEPIKIERDLMDVVPKKDWFPFTYLMIEFGRKYCPARPHDHAQHPLGDYCNESRKTS
jgi:endonuclease-3